MSEKKILHGVSADARAVDHHCDYLFWCPGCECAHGIWTEHRNGVGAVWQFNGDRERPTFTPSLLIRHPIWVPPVTAENSAQYQANPWHQTKRERVCHLFVRNGQLEFLSDCTHSFAGKTIDMVAF